MGCLARRLCRRYHDAQWREEEIQDQRYVTHPSHIFTPFLTRCSAFSTFLLAMGVTTGYIYRYGPQSFTFLYEKWVGFVTAALLMSITQGIVCYAASFIPG